MSWIKNWIVRGHPFVRYADDCLILVKSLRATERVRDSISEFIEKILFLKVNKEKTETGPIVGKKYLGILSTEKQTANATYAFTRKANQSSCRLSKA